ncbi:hypothetical protein CIT37_12855 [Bradyrhizobium ottawaense]|uniref:hypothetical protein n=1 Tax=Bradyrhizobium ottawaense TaxID=931866 RepID=UPI001FCE8309|nr:hypothetical protein [Bradyrhizobium ottawaense]
MTREIRFIELNRTFHELSQHAGKSDDVDLSQVFHVRSNLGWADVLQMPRAVILSEAGSGKTQEIRNVASRLRAEGKAAFFLRLELIPEDFDIAFEVGSIELFDNWVSSSETGWLLLDSVDEARLRSPLDFERSVRRLGKLIEKAKARSHIILTGRTHAWRPKTDVDLCERHIGFLPQACAIAGEETAATAETEVAVEDDFELSKQEEPSNRKFRIIALDDLSQDQVKIFAEAKGVADVGNFVREIERVDAWSSTTRPQDLEDVIVLWNDKGEIGNRLQVMKNSTARRLSERDQPRAEAQPLSDDRALEGAKLIAGAATLGQTQVIRVPDGASNTAGLSAKEVLPGWGDDEIAALLSRPMFDDAIYGVVRFHHRSAREYLTAVWLKQLLDRPASRKAVEDLLFKTIYGIEVVVPTMRPVLPWLAIFDDKIRERVRNLAPEVIVEGGDPNSLPLPTRREILDEICAKIAQERVVHSATEYSAVQRFAQADIAEDIRRLLKQYASNDAVTGFLTRMIWLGRLQSLQLEAQQVALSRSASRYTRISAIRAVREVGTEVDLANVRQAFLLESPRLDRDWLGELVTDLPPSADNVVWVLSAIEKAKDKEPYSVDRLTDALTSFSDAADLRLLSALLDGIVKLFDTPPYIERGYCEVSQRYSWIMKAAAHAVERLISAKDPAALHWRSLETLRKFRAVREWGEEAKEIKVGFGKTVPGWLELNDASFWHDIAETRKVTTRKKDEPLTDFWPACVFGAFWKFNAGDFDRVCEWIENRSEPDDRLVALSLAFSIYAENDKPRAWRERLKQICARDEALKAKLVQLTTPSPEALRYRQEERRWKRRADARKQKELDQFAKNVAYAQGNLDFIRDPKFPSADDLSQLQWYLHHFIREQSEGNSSKWTEGRWRELIPSFGRDVAEAYRDGAINYWRKYHPVLRSEGATPNQTSNKVIFGLTGLAIELREYPDTLRTLMPEQVTRATRYAVHELNGFPAWFADLYAHSRADVLKVILGEIDWELKSGSPESNTNYVLSDISWSAEWAWNDIAPELFDRLQKFEPKNASQLHHIIKIMQGSSIADADIARLAASKVNDENNRHMADWFAVWVGVDPGKAIPALSEKLRKETEVEKRTLLAMHFVTKLWGGRRSETFGARSAFRTPAHLEALYEVMHECIRVQEDIERASGVAYSPELRDDAQDGRNRILNELVKVPGKEAFLALQAIAKAHRQHPSFPHLENLCRHRAEQDADLQAWSPEAVCEFNERLDRTPSTHRELADLAMLRFLDLKDELENGDDSISTVVRAIEQETVLRNFIGRELREKAFGRYAIPQEEQFADDKKPDLRFHGMGFDAPVPVELKISDNWTGPKLFERLENQLAGDYLRDRRGGRGIFLLVYRGEKKGGWQIPGARNFVNFDELVAALRRHWASISSKFANIDDITIVGIDLTKRSN